MNVIDDQESGGQQNREASDMGKVRVRLRHGLDEPRSRYNQLVRDPDE